MRTRSTSLRERSWSGGAEIVVTMVARGPANGQTLGNRPLLRPAPPRATSSAYREIFRRYREVRAVVRIAGERRPPTLAHAIALGVEARALRALVVGAAALRLVMVQHDVREVDVVEPERAQPQTKVDVVERDRKPFVEAGRAFEDVAANHHARAGDRGVVVRGAQHVEVAAGRGVRILVAVPGDAADAGNHTAVLHGPVRIEQLHADRPDARALRLLDHGL